jgi:AraC-like DNA-binding protein
MISSSLGLAHLEPNRPGVEAVWMASGPTRYDVSGAHYHPGFELGVVLKGPMQVEFNDCTLSCQPGDVWLANAWETHRCVTIDPLTEQFVTVFRFEFLGEEWVGEVPWLILFALNHSHLHAASNGKLRSRVLDIAQILRDEALHRAPRWELVVRLELLRLFTEIERNCFLMGAPIKEAQPRATTLARVMPALSLLRSRPLHRVSLREAAKACGLSPSRFHALFADVFGMTYAQLCLQNRLSLASSMLVNTDEPIAAIAAETGFANSGHLHRYCRRHFGCTPGQYRDGKWRLISRPVLLSEKAHYLDVQGDVITAVSLGDVQGDRARR